MRSALCLTTALFSGAAASCKPFGIRTAVYDTLPDGYTFNFVWSTLNGTESSVVTIGNSRYSGTLMRYIDSGSWQHYVRVPSLADTTYEYTVGDGLPACSSAPQTLKTPPRVGPTSNLTVTFFGDLGIDDSARGTVALWSRLPTTDLYQSLGDHVYADDLPIGPNGESYEANYDSFVTSIAGVASRRPFHVISGNHDVSCSVLGRRGCPEPLTNFVPYRHRWRMPQHETTHNLWYSVDIGPVHLVAISTEVDFPTPGKGPEGANTVHAAGPFGDQLAWLKADLAAAVANRATVPWIVVMGHRPPYTARVADWPLGFQFVVRETLEPILQEFNVDLFISGHVHAWERHWPIKDGAPTGRDYVNVSGVTYIVNGAAGNMEGHSSLPPIYNRDWQAVRRNDVFGSAIATFTGPRLMRMTFFAQDTKEIDTFEIVKFPTA